MIDFLAIHSGPSRRSLTVQLWTAPADERPAVPGCGACEERPIAVRPMLKPALRRLWRDPSTLQLGVDPRRAIVLGGIDPVDLALLDLIDGRHEVTEIADDAERKGHPRDRTLALLNTLDAADALDDGDAAPPPDARLAPDLLSLSLVHRGPGEAPLRLARRRSAAVEVRGAGRVGATLARALNAAGVGHLAVTDDGPVRDADLAPGGIRVVGAHVTTRAQQLRREIDTEPSVVRRADALIVLAPTGGFLPPEWLATARHQVHLPVLIRETTASIGPLVLPGSSPCLRCLELARGERDPVWPALTAQLVGQPAGVEPCDVVLAGAAASIAALHVLAWIEHGDDRPPPSVGGVFELSLVDLRLRRRTITAHPDCGCGAVGITEPHP